MDECPHCNVPIDSLFESYLENAQDDQFEIDCPHCSKRVEVSVELTPPSFDLNRVE